MKKRLLAAAVAATVTLSVGVAMAAPVDLNGEAQVHYRFDTKVDSKNYEGGRFTLRLNAQTALTDNVDAYARFAVQKVTGDQIGRDFNNAYYSDNSAAAFDRFGFIVKGKDSTVKIGRQGATIGATALLFSTDSYIGSRNGSIDGVTANVKTGVTDLQLVAGEEKETHNDKNKVYGLHAGYSPVKDVTVGATLAKYDPFDADATNYWAVDAAYNVGKIGYFGEFAKSDANQADKAIAVGASYSFDAKNSFAAIYSEVEENAAMGANAGWTDFDGDAKGMYYSYNHKLTNDTTLNVFYKDMKTVSDKKDFDSFRTTVNFKF